MMARISEVGVATIAGQLPAPVIFGDWVMTEREFVVVRLRSTSGQEGWAFTLTRNGSVADQIRKSLLPVYKGAPVHDPAATYQLAQRSNLACHSSGVGLRGLSILDLAHWDLASRETAQSITAFLGGTRERMPATAIVGYPPGEMDGPAVVEQVSALSAQGWNRFKLPFAADAAQTLLRLQAARSAAPEAWLGCDAAWMFDDVTRAAEFAESAASVNLGWFEDIFAPGDASVLADLRARVNVPIAMGDEQGGSYYPDALLDANAVDVVRIDLTCMGGISGGRRIVERCEHAGVGFAPHMFAHVHSQIFGAWGYSDVPVEWGVPWTGVDPYADSLAQPTIGVDGKMEPLPESHGFGPLLNRDWAQSQPHDDPEGILQ